MNSFTKTRRSLLCALLILGGCDQYDGATMGVTLDETHQMYGAVSCAAGATVRRGAVGVVERQYRRAQYK